MATRTGYRAFLSYSHADESWARWLHRALEQFRAKSLPVGLRGADPWPLRPVFRDREELSASASLSKTLERALLASDALVVLCSPAAAASRWVDQEIACYKAAGRSERVFAVIVGGDPSGSESCFPPSLLAEFDAMGRPTGRQLEPLAVDMRADRRTGKTKLIAALLEVDFDQLRNREAALRRTRLTQQTVAGVGMVTIAAGVTYLVTRETPCLDRATLTASLLSEDRAARIGAAFEATALPFAGDAWRRIRPRLEGHAAEWAAAHVDACEATRVRKSQSDRLFDLRMSCLDGARARFEAVLDELERADERGVERAAESVGLLASIARCADRDWLEARFPPPGDPVLASRVTSLFETLATARTALSSGRIDEARQTAAELVIEAEDTGYPPLQAAVLLLDADARRDAGSIREARDAYYRAAALAVQARDPETAAAAWLGLPLELASGEASFDEAARLARLAESYIDQLPASHPLAARYHFVVGTVHTLAGELDAGVAELRQAVTLAERTHDIALPEYLSALSWALVGINEVSEARGLAERAVAETAATYGTHHPRYADALSALSRVEMRLGSSKSAVMRLEQAVAILEAIHPEGHAKVARALEQLAWLLKEDGRYDESKTTARRALVMLDAMEQPNWAVSGSVHNTLGDILVDLEQFAEARLEFEAALRDWSNLGDHPNASIALGNLGNLANREGRHREARRHCGEALRRDAATYGADNVQLAYALSCIGEAQVGLGQPDAAVATLRRALELRSRPDVDPGRVAWSRWLLGKALWAAGDERAALADVRQARAVIASLPDAAAETREIDAWLAQRVSQKR
jgi:tetratricopeptide (TPR) repeat protein